MKELAKKYINENCMISSFDGNKSYKGVIKEVTDGAILLQKGDKVELINLDFVGRIRVLPEKN